MEKTTDDVEAIKASIFEVVTQINNLEAYYFPELSLYGKTTREANLVRLQKKLVELREELARTMAKATEEVAEVRRISGLPDLDPSPPPAED